MVRGFFVDNVPFVRVVVGFGRSIQEPVFVLDTGFSGDLQVTPAIALELGLTPIGATRIRTADGSTHDVPIALAIAALAGTMHPVEVIITGGFPLLGIGLLTKCCCAVTIDCVERVVALERR